MSSSTEVATHTDTLSDGLIRVTNTAQAGWAPESAWYLEEDLRLGTMSEEGPEQFGQVSGFLTDEADRIYIIDYMDQQIEVFEADGTHSHTIGRQGQGPGEMAGTAGMNWGPEGNLWVWDTGNDRFGAFTPEGDWVTSHLRTTRGVLFPWRGEFTPEGEMVDWGVEHVGLEPTGAGSPTHTRFFAIRLGRDFSLSDTVLTLEYERENTSDGEASLPFGRGMSTYQDRSGHVWVALDNKVYTITRMTLDGRKTLEFSLEVEPHPVTAADRDSMAATYADLPPQVADRYARALEEVPETQPVVRRIFGDNAGLIFVLPHLPAVGLGTAVDVFRETGEYLGRMRFPDPIIFPYPPPYASGEHIHVGVADPLDVPYAVRLRIVRPGAGGG